MRCLLLLAGLRAFLSAAGAGLRETDASRQVLACPEPAYFFDCAVEVHQKSRHVQLRTSAVNGLRQPIQLPFVDLSFFSALLFGRIKAENLFPAEACTRRSCDGP